MQLLSWSQNVRKKKNQYYLFINVKFAQKYTHKIFKLQALREYKPLPRQLIPHNS